MPTKEIDFTDYDTWASSTFGDDVDTFAAAFLLRYGLPGDDTEAEAETGG